MTREGEPSGAGTQHHTLILFFLMGYSSSTGSKQNMGTGNLLTDEGAEGEDNEPRKFDIYTSDSGKVGQFRFLLSTCLFKIAKMKHL